MSSGARPGDILAFVPAGWTLESHQRKLLLEYERIPEYVRVVAIEAPVAAGKSLIGYVIASFEAARWRAQSTIMIRDNALIAQIKGDFPDVVVAPYRGYTSEQEWENRKGAYARAPIRLANFYQHISMRIYPHTLIIDEFHQAAGVLQDFEGVKLWHHLIGMPEHIRRFDEACRWIAQEKEERGCHSTVKKAFKLINKDANNITYEWGTENYRGTERTFLRLFPLTPKNNSPIFWPPAKVKRIVVMSATLAPDDIIDVGLGKAKTTWLKCDSSIPVERRLCIYEPFGNMSFYKAAQDLGKMALGIEWLAERHAGRGIVHITYGLAGNLGEALRRLPSVSKRIITHSPTNKAQRFKEWQASPDGILIAAGMAEGIDLKYDKARWQVIAKIVWPNKMDKAVAAKMEERPDWYGWETLKIVMQQYGRICRRPDDEGVTYICDEQFTQLLKKSGHLAAKWFRQALR